MAEEPDRLRQDIEYTRASLTRDVDALAEKTSPKRVAQRRWTAVREKVMGTSDHAQHAAQSGLSTAQDKASQAGHAVSDKASQAGHAVSDKASQAGQAVSEKAHDAAATLREAPQTVTRQAQGNPIAAGVIAFGVGLLAATLIPATDAERRAGQQIKDNSGDLTDKVKNVAGEVATDLKSTAQEAAQSVKQTAQDAAQQTKQQAQSSAQDAAQQTKQATQNA